MSNAFYGASKNILWLFCLGIAIRKIHCDDFDIQDPTIHAAKNVNYTAAAINLRHAMEGYGTNENLIINVLTTHTLSQRRRIAERYSKKFKRNLMTDLATELSGSFENLMIALLKEPDVLLSEGLYYAMKGWGTDEATLTEILCCRSGKDIKKIADAYKTLYKKNLETVVHSETSGNYRQLLHQLLTKERKSDPVNTELSKKVAQAFVRAGYGGKGKMSAELIIEQLTTYSFAQLAAAMKEIIGQDFRESVKKAFTGDFGTAVLSIVDCAENRPKAYAMRLKQTMGRFTNEERALIRIIVLRSAIDLNRIRQEYFNLYKETLENRIRKSTNNDFRHGLIALLTGEQPKSI